MDILIDTIISGLAVAYVVEFLTSVIPIIWLDRVIKRYLTLPLSVLGCWIFGIQNMTLWVCSCAASCVALFVVFLVNRPTVVTNNSYRR